MPVSPKSQATPNTVTVSQLNRQVKRLLEGHFDFIWVEGELSNLAQPGSGHWYFTLKDDSAQVRCAMFRNRNQLVRLRPRNGQQVLVRARVSLYEGRGEFQLIVEHLEDAGAGALQRAIEELRARLQAEGLFDPANRRSLPALPSHVVVITSPTGAAIHDILTVFRRRFPGIRISLLPVPVQGEAAAPAIARALSLAGDIPDADAVLLARGGGSLEDLLAFNQESVARAIAACALPVVCGVGHESDVTIADLAADVRAATPSAAAELLSPDRSELLLELGGLETALRRGIHRQLRREAERLLGLKRRLRHPGDRLREQAQRLDGCELRLRRAWLARLTAARAQLATSEARLRHHSPARRLEALGVRLNHLSARIPQATRRNLRQSRDRLALLSGKLNSLSPLATLERGYAIVIGPGERVVIDAEQVEAGDVLETRLARGRLKSRVLPPE